MIEIIVLIILIFFVIYTLAILAKSLVLFVINVTLIWVVFTAFFRDWKKKEMRLYYFYSALLVIFLYILQDHLAAGFMFKRLTEVLVLDTVQIILLILIFAHLLFWAGKWVKRLVK